MFLQLLWSESKISIPSLFLFHTNSPSETHTQRCHVNSDHFPYLYLYFPHGDNKVSRQFRSPGQKRFYRQAYSSVFYFILLEQCRKYAHFKIFSNLAYSFRHANCQQLVWEKSNKFPSLCDVFVIFQRLPLYILFSLHLLFYLLSGVSSG